MAPPLTHTASYQWCPVAICPLSPAVCGVQYVVVLMAPFRDIPACWTLLAHSYWGLTKGGALLSRVAIYGRLAAAESGKLNFEHMLSN